MTATNVTPGARGSNYQRRDPVCAALGRRLDLTEESAHQVIYGGKIAKRFAAIIDAFAECDEFDRLERFIQPVRAALLGVSSPQLTRDLIVRAQRADVLEDLAETEHLETQSPETRRVWIQRVREQVATGQALLSALMLQEEQARA